MTLLMALGPSRGQEFKSMGFLYSGSEKMQSQPVEAVRGELGSVFFSMENVTLQGAGRLEARHGEKQRCEWEREGETDRQTHWCSSLQTQPFLIPSHIPLWAPGDTQHLYTKLPLFA